jgi:hypothetical protein
MSLPHDIRQAFRLIRKAPWFTAASVTVLGLGIGATTAIFSLVDAALLRPLPYRDAHQLVMLWERSAQNPRSFVSLQTFADWRDSARSFTNVAASAGALQIPIARGVDEVPESAVLESVTPSFFTVYRGVLPSVRILRLCSTSERSILRGAICAECPHQASEALTHDNDSPATDLSHKVPDFIDRPLCFGRREDELLFRTNRCFATVVRDIDRVATK